ncbi:Mrp/NBP35 family ATP-binding protein [Natrinema gelatinilyticum]|uniref:Mrp/NBP35 family ATP-binding protein n=1 Tax=Natrinema gelatinilyticum TaxID=2961571 RepID=UPI0020C21B1B|nr:Mrp/NBP35 family ATP-binding protein [Natrinema gelatinilyticum]
MSADRTPTEDENTEAAVREAIADAQIGRDVAFAGLDRLNGLSSIALDGSTLRVTLSLPAPSATFRSQVEREIHTAVRHIDGVTEVTCEWDASAADVGARVDSIPDVKNVIGVASGKGGVGKSTVAVNLAAALADAGANVGLLDADVYGPNAPQMLGLADTKPATTPDDTMVPREAHGVRVMSMGFIVEEDDPIIWRGPLVDEFVKQLFDDVNWGALDYLIVDLPPGTGDTQLSLVQHFPVTGIVVVTTPQPVAVDDARRGLEGFNRYDVPILGIAENMAGFTCPDCGSDHDIFGDGGARQLATEYDVPVLGRLPLDSDVGTLLTDDDDGSRFPGISIPGIGRLQLPRTRAERERPDSIAPIAIRENGGESSAAVRLLATRTAARVNALSNPDLVTPTTDGP